MREEDSLPKTKSKLSKFSTLSTFHYLAQIFGKFEDAFWFILVAVVGH